MAFEQEPQGTEQETQRTEQESQRTEQVAPAPVQQADGGRFWQRKAPALAAAMLLLAGVIAGGGVTYGYLQAQGATAQAGSVLGARPGQSVAYTAPPGSVEQLYQQVAPAVVRITQTATVQKRRGTQTAEAVGTGIVLDKQGHILTNNHVIADGGTLQVEFLGGKAVTGTVVGTDPGDDLALVKVDPAGLNLVPAQLGDSNSVQVGQPVVAIGNPFGDYGWSISSGIISGLDRELPTDSGRVIKNLLQTDAAINPGNSGGPLLDLQGRVIGINTAIQSPVGGSVGIGFAIPIHLAESVLGDLTKGGQVQHPWMGLSLATVTKDVAAKYNLGIDHGAFMPGATDSPSIAAGSPAEKAGLRQTLDDGNGQVTVGDVITGVDSVTVNKPQELIDYVNTKHTGDKVTLHVFRDGKTVDVPVTLGAWPAQVSSQ